MNRFTYNCTSFTLLFPICELNYPDFRKQRALYKELRFKAELSKEEAIEKCNERTYTLTATAVFQGPQPQLNDVILSDGGIRWLVEHIVKAGGGDRRGAEPPHLKMRLTATESRTHPDLLPNMTGKHWLYLMSLQPESANK